MLVSAVWAKKHKSAPHHNNIEKPPKICLANLIHSGVEIGGVKVLGPSLSKFSRALAWVKPYYKINKL